MSSVNCRFRLPRQMPDGSEVVTPSGSLAAWKAAGVFEFACSGCGERQKLKCALPLPDDFTFDCPGCGHHVGVEEHRSGARIFWLVYYLRHLFEPPGSATSRYRKVPYTCASCGAINLIRPACTRDQRNPPSEWQGLCPECFDKEWAHPWKITSDYCLLSYRSVVCASRREGTQVPILCGLRGCGIENWFNVYSIKGKGFTGYCPGHTVSEMAALLLTQADENSNGQKNGDAEKKQHGGHRWTKWTLELEQEFLTQYEQMQRRIKDKDPSLPASVRENLLLPGNQPSDVARDYVAELLNVESNEYLRTVLTRARKRRKQGAR